MKNLPKISRIVSVAPFTITLLWNNFEVRALDFEPLFQVWKKDNDAKMAALEDFDTFSKVIVSENHTLAWPNIPITFTFKGNEFVSPLELDAQELYHRSVLVEKIDTPNIGKIVRQAREKAGLTQLEVALNAGTTAKYISRLENNKSDIQLGTLRKIAELGMNQKISIIIEGDFQPGQSSKPKPKPRKKATADLRKT